MIQILQGIEFAITLLIAEYLFVFTLEKQNFFMIKAVTGGIFICIAFIVIPNLGNMEKNPLWGIVIYLALFLISMAYFRMLYKDSIWKILFCCIAGYTTQHLWFHVHMVLERLYKYTTELNVISAHYILSGILLFALICRIVYSLFAKKIQDEDCGNINNHSIIFLSGTILLITIVFNLLFGAGNAGIYLTIVFHFYVCLTCCISLVIQFSIMDKTELRYELETVQQLLRQEKKQYEISKENIEFLNILCHDLKYQFHQNEEKADVLENYLKNIYTAVDLYDMSVKTGNSTLDIILTENTLWCKKNDITLTCMADGEGLAFMDEVDIYSLFGNAIGNAIESTQKLKEKRFISLIVRRVEKLLSIQIENYFEGKIELREGFPYTTKRDSESHGYGIKSMQRIVTKYEGNLSINIHEDIFSLNMYIPIPNISQCADL